MTLKTFHFAGVASMSISLGVPRIREIINASKTIKTPIIAAKLVRQDSETVARMVKGRIEATTLGGIIEYMEEMMSIEGNYLQFKIDMDAIRNLRLEIDIYGICDAIAAAPKLKINGGLLTVRSEHDGILRLQVLATDKLPAYYEMKKLKRALPAVVIMGIPTINRAVINEQEGKSGLYELLAEGYGMREVMNIDGIVGTETKSNHVNEMEKVLGIEAARQTIID